MSDLVERLRENPVAYAETAAKELERLRAELAEMKKVLRDARDRISWDSFAPVLLANIDAALAKEG